MTRKLVAKLVGKYAAATAAILVLAAFTVNAQTTVFTFQGKLKENSLSANGTYEMRFALFDSLSNGNQSGSLISISNVSVVDGIFTVELDFGLTAFSGAGRFLEIEVRAAGNAAPLTRLSPRQPVTSAPYAVRSLNAQNADQAANAENSQQLGGVDADHYVLTNDGRLSDTRDPNAGSGFYIQNRTTQQAAANFNIAGNGIVSGVLSGATINAATQFNFGNNRILAAGGTDNLFVGVDSGTNNTGFSNTFAGRGAGRLNTSANFNSFFGHLAGGANTTGGSNTFIGRNAGAANTTGSSNTAVGSGANVSAGNFIFATAVGAGAMATESNSVVLGRGNDVVIVPGDLNVKGSISVTDGVVTMILPNQGTTPLCSVGLPNSLFFTLARCSSSLRYKNNVETFTAGLQLLERLRPVTYNWKINGTSDIGFIAEEVAGVEPLLATYNEDGQVEGVKYGQITTVLVNAVKEQQKQIGALKQIVCKEHPQAKACN